MGAYLLSIGDLEECTVRLDEAVRAVVDSPYADRNTIRGNFIKSKASSLIIEEFYQHRKPRRKDSAMHALHLVLTGNGAPLSDLLWEASETALCTLECCDRQCFMVRHIGSATSGLGEHYHFIISPEQMFLDEAFVPSRALFKRMIDMLDWFTYIHWTHKYCYTNCFRQTAENTYAEVYNPAEMRYFY